MAAKRKTVQDFHDAYDLGVTGPPKSHCSEYSPGDGEHHGPGKAMHQQSREQPGRADAAKGPVGAQADGCEQCHPGDASVVDGCGNHLSRSKRVPKQHDLRQSEVFKNMVDEAAEILRVWQAQATVRATKTRHLQPDESDARCQGAAQIPVVNGRSRQAVDRHDAWPRALLGVTGRTAFEGEETAGWIAGVFGCHSLVVTRPLQQAACFGA